MTNKFSLFGIIALLLLSVSSLAFYLYESNGASVLHQSVMRAQSSYDMKQAELAQDEAIIKSKRLNTIHIKTIPQKSDETGLILEFSKISLLTGAQVQSLTFGANSSTNAQNSSLKSATSANSEKTAESVNITVSGTTGQLLNFIDSLQSNSRFSIITDCDLSSESSKTQMTVQMNFPYTQR